MSNAICLCGTVKLLDGGSCPIHQNAYTPRSEYQCSSRSTHYQGCQCHEARHQEELDRLKSVESGLADSLVKMTIENIRLVKSLQIATEALEKIATYPRHFEDGQIATEALRLCTQKEGE